MDGTQAGRGGQSSVLGSGQAAPAASSLANRIQLPSIRRWVLYRMTEADARRANGQREQAIWRGGNECHKGDVYPMLIVRVFDAVPRPDSLVNGQVHLDGNDVLWVMSVKAGDDEGMFSWGVNA